MVLGTTLPFKKKKEEEEEEKEEEPQIKPPAAQAPAGEAPKDSPLTAPEDPGIVRTSIEFLPGTKSDVIVNGRRITRAQYTNLLNLAAGRGGTLQGAGGEEFLKRQQALSPEAVGTRRLEQIREEIGLQGADLSIEDINVQIDRPGVIERIGQAVEGLQGADLDKAIAGIVGSNDPRVIEGTKAKLIPRLTGTAVGAAIGSFIPGVGTAAGAAVGGGVSGLFSAGISAEKEIAKADVQEAAKALQEADTNLNQILSDAESGKIRNRAEALIRLNNERMRLTTAQRILKKQTKEDLDKYLSEAGGDLVELESILQNYPEIVNDVDAALVESRAKSRFGEQALAGLGREQIERDLGVLVPQLSPTPAEENL